MEKELHGRQCGTKSVWLIACLLFGIGATFNYTNRPAQVVNLTNVIGISAGACHTLALKSDYTVWAFGQNSEGQIGLSNAVVNTNKPVMLAGVSNAALISAGGFHSL